MANQRSPESTVNPARVDDLDRGIISLLEEDGRRSYKEISQIVGLSEAATRQRVRRLQASKVLRIVGVADPLALGAHTVAMVGVSCSGDLRQIASALGAIDEIVYVVNTAGRYQILLEVICASGARLLDLLNEHVHSIEGVTSTETFTYLRIEKQTFTWMGS